MGGVKTLPLLLAIVVAGTSTASETTDNHPASKPSITLSLSDLWSSSAPVVPESPEPAPPPVTAALLSAIYTLDLAETPPVLRLVATAENFTNTWQMVPIHGSELPFNAEDPSGLVRNNNQLQWMSETRGVRTFVMQAPLPAARDGGWQMPLHTMPSARSLLIVSSPPEGQEILVHGATALVNEGPATHWQLPADGTRVSIEVATPRPVLSSDWELNTALLVQPAEQWLAYDSRLQLSARSGSALDARILLPAKAREIVISGADLESWRLQREDGGPVILHLKWRTRDVLDREISMRYRIAQAPLADVWTLSAPRLEDGQAANHFIIVPPAGTKISGKGLQEGAARNRLPQWMAESVGPAPFAVLAGETEARLNVSWLPQVETAPAVVTKGTHRSRIVEDGSMLTEATYQIALEQPTSWRVTLPEGSRLLACTVDDKSAEPVAVDGALEFALPAAGTREAKVFISYTGNAGALDLIGGRLELTLPVTPLFAHELNWHLSLPASYEIDAVESNLTMDPAATHVQPGDLILTRRLTRDITPTIEIFYKKRGLNHASN